VAGGDVRGLFGVRMRRSGCLSAARLADGRSDRSPDKQCDQKNLRSHPITGYRFTSSYPATAATCGDPITHRCPS
jgi:hypothetical protein